MSQKSKVIQTSQIVIKFNEPKTLKDFLALIPTAEGIVFQGVHFSKSYCEYIQRYLKSNETKIDV